MIRASVIIPVYQQWHLVGGLLDALARQTLPADAFEVILVNNGPPEAVSLGELPVNARLMHCAAPGSYAARNAGAEAARGRWLVFTDSDCMPEPQWLSALDAAAEAEPEAIHAGRVVIVPMGETPNAVEMFDMVTGLQQERYVASGYAATANLLVPRELFWRLSGFDARRMSGGDVEFTRRAVALGYALRYVADAVVRHPARASLGELVVKARRVKGGQLLLGPGKRRLRYFAKSFVPPMRAIFRTLRSNAHGRRYRFVASGILLHLWAAGLVEALRLIVLRLPPERR